MGRFDSTHQRLQSHAMRLFAEHGFDNVTVEQVAAAAGVSHMTFFRHFPTKDSVVLDDPYDPMMGAAVARQDHQLPPLERVRLGFLESWNALETTDAEATRTRIHLAANNRNLRARVWENNLRTEDVIVDALIATGVPQLDARVAVGAVNGAVTAALFDWAENEDSGLLGDRIRSALDLLSSVHETDIPAS